MAKRTRRTPQVFNKSKLLMEDAERKNCPRCRGFGRVRGDDDNCHVCAGHGIAMVSESGWVRPPHTRPERAVLY